MGLLPPRRFPPKFFDIHGGPHDGVKVARIGPDMPDTIYCNMLPVDDWAVTWSRTPHERFPFKYNRDGGRFVYEGRVIQGNARRTK